MIYTGLNRTGEILAVKAHGGADVAEVYGGINEANPIYYKTRTITGQTPLSYKALSKPLSDYLISGNTLQDGTPTPEAPVDVVGCGERTGNLFDAIWYSGSLGSTGSMINDTNAIRSAPLPCNAETTYTFVLDVDNVESVWVNYYGVTNTIERIDKSSGTFTTPSACEQVRFRVSKSNIGIEPVRQYNAMLNLGATALPYEPYGFKLPLTINGVEHPIYLGQVETTRRIKKLVLTGEEAGWTVIASGNQALLQLPATVVSRTVFSTHYKGLVQAVTGNAWINASLDMLIIMDTTHATDVTTFKSYLTSQYANGTPVTVWYVLATPETGIVNEPLMKIGDYADTVSMAQAGVTIPTTAGTNQLTVGTTVQPSEVSITGNIKEVQGT